MSDYIKDDKRESIINLQSVREKSNKKGFLYKIKKTLREWGKAAFFAVRN